MIFELNKTSVGLEIGTRFTAQAASALGVREKAIENWIASHPDMLFQTEKLLVIGQSIAGQSMADVLALDASGALVVVEVKRDWSDRETVGQLLEYAASMHGAPYERLNSEARRYRHWEGGSLIERFRDFADQPDFPQDQLGRRTRVIIVAPDSDQGLRSIVEWLGAFGVPIAFIPFSIYADADGEPRLLQIEGAPAVAAPLAESQDWRGHWIFNTNEANAPGAWQRMFDMNIAAIYGYASGPKNLEGASPNNTVLAYVNRQGLRAVGTVVDGIVRPGTGVFEDPPGQQASAEYHLAVRWDCVVPPESALSATEAAALGYHLPVRSVFARLQQGSTAAVLESTLRRRCRGQVHPTEQSAENTP